MNVDYPCRRSRPLIYRASFTLGILVCSMPLLAASHRKAPLPPDALYYADAYADHYHVPRELVHAIIRQESGWNRTAVSSKKAMGLMQLMPRTAARYGVAQPFSCSDNISGGVRYLADLMQQFGDLRLVVAAYYAGEDQVAKHGLKLSSPKVIAYVNSVRKLYLNELAKSKGASNEQ